jgi:mRNA interferase HigB
MRIIAKRTLREFWEKHADARGPLEAWHSEARAANWASPQDIKLRYGRASFLGDNRVVFDIGGNKYRLVVKMNYFYKMVYIRFIGTHAEYDRVDVEHV